MPAMLPSQMIDAIDDLFGPARQELDERRITGLRRAEVHALLSLLDEVPKPLLDLSHRDYLEFARCRASLATALARWNVGDDQPAKPVYGKDPVERIRRLLGQCGDELPTPETDLPFIVDLDLRHGIQDRISAAWTDYGAREWMGATVFGGAALEALLLWAWKAHAPGSLAGADRLHLGDLITKVAGLKLIGEQTEQLAKLAQDARNLIHPGRAARSGMTCSRATALTALGAVFAVIEDFKKTCPPHPS